MEIRYSREMSHNYMIIEASEENADYTEQMLSVNSIEGLLKFRVRQTEEAREYYYEITSRQPLRRVLEKRTLSGQELRSILLGILAVLKRVEDYLLKEEQLLLDPEYVYLEPDRFTVELCLVPGHREETPQALSKLLGYLLERADHQDREAVVLAYNLYQISLKENYGIADLLRQLSGEDKIFAEEVRKREEVCPEMLGEPADGSVRFERENRWNDEAEFREKIWKKKETDSGEWERSAPDHTLGTVRKNAEPVNGMEPEGENPGKIGGKPKGQWLNRWIRILGIAVTAGIAYWYVTGEADVWLYVISGGTGGLVWLRESWSNRRKRQMYGGQRQKQSEEECEKEKRPGRRSSKSSFAQGGEKESISRNGTIPGKEAYLRTDWQQEAVKNRWQIYPESEEMHQKELQREEEAQIERAREAGTTLLSEVKKREEKVRLEPLEAGGTVISISYVPFTVGKHPELADACIDRPTVSRLHARFDQKEGVYILTDLNSTNGTSVNGYLLQANETVSLENGDSVYLADVGYKFWENG